MLQVKVRKVEGKRPRWHSSFPVLFAQQGDSDVSFLFFKKCTNSLSMILNYSNEHKY